MLQVCDSISIPSEGGNRRQRSVLVVLELPILTRWDTRQEDSAAVRLLWLRQLHWNLLTCVASARRQFCYLHEPGIVRTTCLAE